jgi:hypothetical protein
MCLVVNRCPAKDATEDDRQPAEHEAERVIRTRRCGVMRRPNQNDRRCNPLIATGSWLVQW